MLQEFFLQVIKFSSLVFFASAATATTTTSLSLSSPAADRRDHGHLVARGQDRAPAFVVEVGLVEGEHKGTCLEFCLFFIGRLRLVAASTVFSLPFSSTKKNTKIPTFELSKARVGSQDGLLESIGGGSCVVGVERERARETR